MILAHLLPAHLQGILGHPTFRKSTSIVEIVLRLGFPALSLPISWDVGASFGKKGEVGEVGS
jgi:hypothetical protein